MKEKSEIKKAPIVVVAPHPDDEWIGCGCTMLERLDQGHPVKILLITQAPYSKNRIKASKSIAASHGMELVHLGEPELDINFVTLQKFVMNQTPKDAIVYVPTSDKHPDHRKIHSACKATLRNAEIYEYGIYNNSNNIITRAWNKILFLIKKRGHPSFRKENNMRITTNAYKKVIKNEYIVNMFGETARDADLHRRML